MKKILASILAVVGLSASAQPKPEMVDVDSIIYSMPTISGDAIDFVVPTKESFQGAPEFHEDEWRQLEFFPRSQLKAVQSKLKEYKAFEQKNRVSSGWKNIYVRNIQMDNISLTVANLISITASELHPGPLLTSASKPLGQVKNGFSVAIGDGALLYGVAEGRVIKSLAASVYSNAGNIALTSVYALLNKNTELLIVDWRNQMIIMDSFNDGKLGVWKP